MSLVFLIFNTSIKIKFVLTFWRLGISFYLDFMLMTSSSNKKWIILRSLEDGSSQLLCCESFVSWKLKLFKFKHFNLAWLRNGWELLMLVAEKRLRRTVVEPRKMFHLKIISKSISRLKIHGKSKLEKLIDIFQ